MSRDDTAGTQQVAYSCWQAAAAFGRGCAQSGGYTNKADPINAFAFMISQSIALTPVSRDGMRASDSCRDMAH